MGSTTLSTVIVVIYLLVIIGIIVWTGKKASKTYKDFALGGNDIPWPVIAGTMFASTVGGGTMIGYVGNYKAYGMQWGMISLLCFLFGYIYAGYSIAPRMKKLNQYTTGDMLGIRYGNGARYIAAGLNTLGEFSCVVAMASSFATMVSGYLGLNNEIALILGIVIFYFTAVMGGLKGVAWTDAIQAIVIFITVAVVTVLCLGMIKPMGGFAALPKNMLNPLAANCNWLTMSGTILSCFLMEISMQSLFVQRINACRSPGDAKKATLFDGISVFIFMIFGIGFIGLSAYLLTPPDVTGNAVVTAVLAQMPPIIGALYAAAIIAAVLTTANSMLLSSSMSIVRDFMGIVKPELKTDDAKQLKYSRLVMVVICVLALLIVRQVPGVITWIMVTYTIIGSIAFPLYYGLRSKKATPLSGVLGLSLGGGIAILWEILGIFKARPAALADVHAIWVGLIFGIAGTLLGNLSPKKSTKDQLAYAEAYSNGITYEEAVARMG